MPDNSNITMTELRVGMYVYLDLKWFEHPFAFSHFRIKTKEQIEVIRGLGLKTIRVSLDLSDTLPPRPAPLLQSPLQVVTEQPSPAQMPALSPALIAKRAMIERIRDQREATARVESAFINTANTIRDIEKNLFAHPAQAVQNATQLIEQISDSILSAPDLAIHVMGDKVGGEELYFHSLNVTMLSMMMARDIKLPKEVVAALGMGGLFHDIGHMEIPNQILVKKEALTQAERNLYQMHCHYGVEIGQRLKLAPAVLAIISEHHELLDGSGYPGKFKEEGIGLLSRIVIIANHYDELCNPLNVADAMT
ncbi:MAG: HD-GYP domain-containing protein, partial [Burkholderiaceae bacterium]